MKLNLTFLPTNMRSVKKISVTNGKFCDMYVFVSQMSTITFVLEKETSKHTFNQ